MPAHDVEWHLQELARRVLEHPEQRLRIIREYHAELVAAGETATANIILTVRAIATDQGDAPPMPPPNKHFWQTTSGRWKLGIGTAALIALAVFLANRGILPVNSTSPFDVDADYLGTTPTNAPLAVVFVHGITGNKTETWKGQSDTFPALLATDPEFRDHTAVFLFEYYTPQFGSAASIVGLADQLRGTLDGKHVFENHQRVVFIGHSMGGIVIRQFLLNNRDRLAKVPMLYFSATPTNGADLTSVARQLSTNPQLRGMLPLEGNDLLQSIQAGWLGWEDAKKVPSHCAYENLPTYGFMIVPQQSATALCNQSLDPIAANHIDIVKPENRNDLRYAAVANALRRNTTTLKPEKETAAWTPSGKRSRTITTANHHCSSNCEGEPTRTSYPIEFAADTGERFIGTPELKCISGAGCPYSHINYARLEKSGQRAAGSFDVWGHPTTWELSVETESRNEQKK